MVKYYGIMHMKNQTGIIVIMVVKIKQEMQSTVILFG
jgi:hypothetical protein